MNNLFCMDRKVVLITGGSGYLGKPMTEVLSEYGATVIIGSRNEDKNKQLANELFDRIKEHVEVVTLDISNGDMIEETIKGIIDKHKKIDVLINNSYYGAGSELMSMHETEWLKGIDGSVNCCFRMTQAVLKHMLKENRGKIINIASMYGIVAPDVSIYEDTPFYNSANYGVGKAGIIQLTKYIAAVYGKNGITCNAISPGPFPNPGVQQNKRFMENLIKKVPLGKVGVPDDLKGIVLLLSSDASDFINGANISIDGGWTSW